MTKKRKKLERPFTEVELELMSLIWSLGECTVKDVQQALPKERELAYTSVATMMKILEQKGALVSEKKERAHLYRPAIEKAEYESSSLRHLAENLFEGSPSSMVMRLLDDSQLTQDELEAIRKALDERLES